jgi:hypothetical protein
VEATLRYGLARFANLLEPVEVSVSEPTARRHAGEKRCAIRARPNGLAAVTAAEDAPTSEQAPTGAAAKSIVALERALARTDKKN